MFETAELVATGGTGRARWAAALLLHRRVLRVGPRVGCSRGGLHARMTLSLRASRSVRDARLLAGKQRVKVRSRRTGGRLVLTAPVPARKRGRLRIEVVVSGKRYSAFVPRR